MCATKFIIALFANVKIAGLARKLRKRLATMLCKAPMHGVSIICPRAEIKPYANTIWPFNGAMSAETKKIDIRFSLHNKLILGPHTVTPIKFAGLSNSYGIGESMIKS